MIDESTYNDLDRYFHSQMSAEEKEAFASKMNVNDELRTELQWLNQMLGGMKEQGRSVVKQTIMGAIAGVTYDEVAKYKPSLNRKSFFKKYWWAVTSAAVAIGAAVAIYLYTTRHPGPESHDEQENTFSPETIISADSAGAGADSCAEPLMNSTTDSLFKSESEGRIAIRETVNVRYGNDIYLLVDNKNNRVAQAGIFTETDSLKRSKRKPVGYNGGAEDDEYKKDKTKSLGVTTGYKPYPPYTYILDGNNLMLNAPYRSCKGFKWEGREGFQSDTIYMTDKDGVEFMLLRDAGVKLLVPLPPSSNK